MNKRLVVAILLVAPALFAGYEALAFHFHNRENGSLGSRTYLLFVPKSYDASKPVPLVISLHGAGGWPVQQKELSGWNALAERERFLVVYPSGAEAWGPRVWHSTEGEGLKREARFIADLIDALASRYNIDRARIYVNGMSNGGGMSFALSCTLSDRIAAIGMVGAAQTLPWAACMEERPIPAIIFHGTADPMVPYAGGSTWVAPAPFPAVETWTARMAHRNRCTPHPAATAVAPDVTRLDYANCAERADIVLYTIRGGGHTWPGGEPMPEWFTGPTSRSIDATRVMWEFFRSHPKIRTIPTSTITTPVARATR